MLPHSLVHSALEILLAQMTALAIIHLVVFHAGQVPLHDVLAFSWNSCLQSRYNVYHLIPPPL